MPRVDRTEPGSKNDWRITYDTGSQKWTDDRPGDGVGESGPEMLKETLKDPAVKRGLNAVSDAIESGKGLESAVKSMVRDVGEDKTKTLLSALQDNAEKADAPKKVIEGIENARKMVAVRQAVKAAVRDRLPKEIPTVWYENEQGDKWYPDMRGIYEPEAAPEGYIYQRSLDTSLTDSILKIVQADEVANCEHEPEYRVTDHGWVDTMEGERCQKCGGHYVREKGSTEEDWQASGSIPMMTGNSGWPEDLALAMANEGVGLKDAIIIAATACERCMNSLAYEFGLDWGYEEGSTEWKECGTECDFCKDMGYTGQDRLNSNQFEKVATGRMMRLADIKQEVNLRSEYNRFNNKYFDGELPQIKLKWNKSKTAGGYAKGIIDKRTGIITPTEINISTFLKMDKDRFDKIMLHEMVHIWQYINGINEREKRGHGRTFQQKAKEIGSKAGIIIPLTEDISGMEIADDVKATQYVAVIWERNGDKRFSLFMRGGFDKNRTRIEQYFEGLSSISTDFIAKFYTTQERELMMYPAIRGQIPRKGITFYRTIPADLISAVRKNGKLIGEVKKKPRNPEQDKMKRWFDKIGEQVARILTVQYETKFIVNTTLDGERVVCQIIPANANAKGLIRLQGIPPDDMAVFVMKDNHVALEIKPFRKYPTPRTIVKLIESIDRTSKGRESLHKAFGFPLTKVASRELRNRVAATFVMTRGI